VLEDTSVALNRNQSNYITFTCKVLREFRGKERRSKKEKQNNIFTVAQQPWWAKASSLSRLHDHTQTHNTR